MPAARALVADRPLFTKRLGYLRSRLTVPKPSSLQRAPAGQGSFVLPWLAETLQQLRAPMAGRDPPGFWSLQALAKARRGRVFVCFINHHRDYSVNQRRKSHRSRQLSDASPITILRMNNQLSNRSAMATLADDWFG